MAAHRQTVTTAEIQATLRCESSDGRPNHIVQNSDPLDLPAADLPIEPYTFGVWLGDGSSDGAEVTTTDQGVLDGIRADGYEIRKRGPIAYTFRAEPERQRRIAAAMALVSHDGATIRQAARYQGISEQAVYDVMRSPVGRGYAANVALAGAPLPAYARLPARLRQLGVYKDKHIPAAYQRASVSQRRALLAGLLDSDGYCMKQGTVIFAVTCRRLAYDVRELICGLGYTCTMTTKAVRGRTLESSTCYLVCFTPHDEVFRLTRKRDRQHLSPGPARHRRKIVDVRPIRSVPVRCVQVDNESRMYLAGPTMIPTHNSTLALDLARAASVKAGLTSVIFSLEMSRNEITMRLLSAEARVPLSAMRTGQLGDDDWTRLARRMSEVVDAPLFIDDSPNMSMMEIRSKCRRLKQRHDLRLVIVDYMQLMSSPRRVENRQQEVSELSRSLKLLAKELDVPVVALSQLNRGPEQRTDKKPLLADLRESGSIEQDSDVVILLHREDFYERESPRAGEADFIVAKHRNGPTTTVTVAFQGHYSRFVDMAPI
jgi:replicative DNA helicase